MNIISFPNLNLEFCINPIAISIGKINIYWYGILIVLAIIVAIFLAKRDDKLHNIKFNDVFDFLLIRHICWNYLCKNILCFI